jgi:hypothetical protein
MSYFILKHLTNRELPTEWAKHLSAEQTFTVMIVPEQPVLQPVMAQSGTESKVAGSHSQNNQSSQEDGYSYLHNLKENFFDPS